jgi:hypothetical protein
MLPILFVLFDKNQAPKNNKVWFKIADKNVKTYLRYIYGKYSNTKFIRNDGCCPESKK